MQPTNFQVAGPRTPGPWLARCAKFALCRAACSWWASAQLGLICRFPQECEFAPASRFLLPALRPHNLPNSLYSSPPDAPAAVCRIEWPAASQSDVLASCNPPVAADKPSQRYLVPSSLVHGASRRPVPAPVQSLEDLDSLASSLFDRQLPERSRLSACMQTTLRKDDVVSIEETA
jgi:hypothetical protein